MSGLMRSSSVVIGAHNGVTASNAAMRESSTLASPLQIFVRAKKQINDIFYEVEAYIHDTTKFVQGRSQLCSVITSVILTIKISHKYCSQLSLKTMTC